MLDSSVPSIVGEWVKNHPVTGALLAIFVLGALVVFAIRYGDLRNRWP